MIDRYLPGYDYWKLRAPEDDEPERETDVMDEDELYYESAERHNTIWRDEDDE